MTDPKNDPQEKFESAFRILRRGHGKREPLGAPHFEERANAARELVLGVKEAAQRAGYEVPERPHKPYAVEIVHRKKGTVYLQYRTRMCASSARTVSR